MYIIWRYRASVFFLLFFTCAVGQNLQDVGSVPVKKVNQVEQNFGVQDTASEQLFLNLGMKKRWKDTHLKLENAIFKSRIEVLGEIFRAKVDALKKDTSVELIFLVDSSSSVGEENFKSEIKFVQKLVSDFIVSPAETRVAVVTFATSVENHVNHLKEDQEHEKCSLLHKELPSIKYSGGNTFTLGALLEAKKILKHSRTDARRALFLVTDGFSNNGSPVPVAQELKENGVTIFTFGIKSGNVEELYKMSSAPPEEHSFLLESFSEFEASARRALHQDLKSGSYMHLKNQKLCNHLCALSNKTTSESDENSCCNEHSRCSCGTLTGHYSCLCPPGYYGSGLMGEDCKPCPDKTYHDGLVPGDILVCRRCPDSNHKLKQLPGRSKEDCVCKEGFTADGDKCKVITCPSLLPPSNGYFVKKSCSNVLHAACGVRCSIGYELSGSSVRLCQKNGTWSGVPPVCLPRICEALKPVPNAEVICTNEEENFKLTMQYDSLGNIISQQLEKNNSNITNPKKLKKVEKGNNSNSSIIINYTVDTQCQFACFAGFFLVGSKTRTCLPVMRWNGLQTTCKAITCPSLPFLPHGTITPSHCTTPGTKHNYGSECQMSCGEGYIMKGPKKRLCTGKYGTWTGKNTPNRCIDIEPPVFECPKNMTIATDEGVSFAIVNISFPQASDNSGSKPIAWFQPPVGENNSLILQMGLNEIQVHVMDATENSNSCTYYIHVIDKEPPKVFDCDSPSTFFSTRSTVINWIEPTFIDNSKDLIKVNKSHVFGEFPLGTTLVTYSAIDSSDNYAECQLNITVIENPCSKKPTPNKFLNCLLNENITTCNFFCPSDFQLVGKNDQVLSNLTLTCTQNETHAIWSPNFSENDLDFFSECSEAKEPNKISQTGTLELNSSSCQDLEETENEFNREVNDILNNDFETEVTSKCIEIENVDSEEKTNIIQTRKKRSISKRIAIEISVLGSPSEEHTAGKVLHEFRVSREKLQNYFLKKDYIKSKGKIIHFKAIDITKEPTFTCRSGSVPRESKCVDCPKGSFYNAITRNCESCPIGEFQSLEGQLQCVPCPKGYSTKKIHSKYFYDCKMICQPGSFGRKRRNAFLTLHPCITCPSGYYQSLEGQSSCVKCPLGMTTVSRGSITLQQCILENVLKNACLQSPCQNNATCSSHKGYAICHCKQGFAGAFCETVLNPCDSSPCYNSGTCIHLRPNVYTCKCLTGFTGQNCEYEINECDFEPCSNGGECTSIFNGYVCDCMPGFYGDTCNENINECETLQPCLNNGTCTDLVNNYKCTCKDKFSGDHCEESSCDLDEKGRCNFGTIEKQQTSDPCHSLKCPSFMTCKISFSNDPECACREGFRGENCSEVINPHVVLTFPKCSVTDYSAIDLSSVNITEVTVCVWVQTGDKFNYGTLFSYANYDEYNAFTLTDYNGFVLYIRSQRIITDVSANDGLWHFICVSWESKGGSWRVYLDGVLRSSGQNFSSNSSISGIGKLVVGQEQDTYGGGFNEVESFVGKMTYFDMWNRVLTETEIREMNANCKLYNGNLVNWMTLLQNVYGHVKVSLSPFCKNCKTINFLYQGKITLENKGETLQSKYECNEGFYIKFDGGEEQSNQSQRVWYRKCMKHGDWEPNPPRCARMSCGFPGYFPHGFLTGSSYYYKDSITYRCTSGYTLEGTTTRICQANGEWSGTKPFCKGNSTECPQLLAPRHGSMFLHFGHGETKYQHPIQEGYQVEFACDKNYRLKGHGVLTCLGGGNWDNPVPTCEEILCLAPTNAPDLIANSIKSSFNVGFNLEVHCQTTEHKITIVCGNDGTWNLTRDLCDTKCWKRPLNPSHGYLLDDGRKTQLYKENDIISVSCRLGYRLLGDNYLTCTANGTWKQNKKTSCEAVECSEPILIPHAEPLPKNKTYRYGDRVIYKCLPGFQNYEDVSIRCEAESRWSRIRGRCVRINCGKPKEVEYLNMDGATFYYENTISIRCPPGTKLQENERNYITCQKNGQWTELTKCR